MKASRHVLLWAIVLMASAVVALWWLHTFERTDRRIPLPPRGEAAYNPLYALKRAIQEDGIQAQSRRRLSLRDNPLAPGDTLWMLGDVRSLPRRDAATLLDWVGRGGHLVLEAPAPWRQGALPETGPLLAALGVTLTRVDPACSTFGDATARGVRTARAADTLGQRDDDSGDTDAPGSRRVVVCSSVRLQPPPDAQVPVRWRHAGGADLALRLAYGSGSLDLVSSLDFADNDALKAPGSAALARQLLAPNYGRGTVYLVYDAQMPPLWRLLLERAWMAWLPLLLATLGWLWWRTQRRGPLLPTPQPGRRALIEHVQASGEHVHRYGRGHLLHASLRALFDARLRARDPYAASLQGQAQRAAIAARTGLTEAEVDAALRAPVPFVAADLRLRIARLNRLKARL